MEKHVDTYFPCQVAVSSVIYHSVRDETPNPATRATRGSPAFLKQWGMRKKLPAESSSADTTGEPVGLFCFSFSRTSSSQQVEESGEEVGLYGSLKEGAG